MYKEKDERKCFKKEARFKLRLRGEDLKINK